MKEQAINDKVVLLLKQQQGELSVLEQQELDNWADAKAANQRFVDRCNDRDQVATDLAELDSIDEDKAFQRWQAKNGWSRPEEEVVAPPYIPLRSSRRWVWIAAATVMGILAVGGYYFMNKGSKLPAPSPTELAKVEEIQPASKKATLTLGDGRSITLDEAKDGAVTNEDGAAINKKGDALVYDPAGKKVNSKEVLYHAVTTPVGGFYEVTLPDQSKVWLNADSRIYYPTAFIGKERRVEASGELYFEVAKDATKPFIVTTGKMEVKVLGTHFNLRNYNDEAAVKTTLLEGSVQVSNDNKTVALQPGQQAAVGNDATRIPVRSVDLESVVAWKEGYFDFKGEEMADIMKELKRWYAGIDSINVKTHVKERFTATIPRNLPLSTVLKILQQISRFKIEIDKNMVIVVE